MDSQRSDSSRGSGSTPIRPLGLVPRAMSAMGLVRNDSLAGIKASLLSQGRSETMGDLRAARVVKFSRASALADLSYLALPGLTSRVARRSTLPPSASAGRIPHTGSYLRLEQIGASRTGVPTDELSRLLQGEEEEYVEEAGLTPALAKSVSVALLSSFMYGLNGGNMNTPAFVIRAALGIPSSAGASADNVWALCVSLFCVGALLGCNLSGSLADTWGRKKFLLVSASVFAAGGLLEAACALPPVPASQVGGPVWLRIGLLVVGRLITGVACGGATVVVPMYLGEVSPAQLRGTLGTAFQLCSVIAMFAAQVLGLGSVLGTASLWPAVLGFVALPALLQLLLGGLLVESPRWLCMVGQLDEAQLTLALLRNAADPNDEQVLEELDVMITSAEASSSGKAQAGGGSGGATFGALFRPPTRYPLLIAMTLMVVQQFSGINNAFNFSSVFLKKNGMDDGSVQLIAILMNLGNVLITLLSVYLMDKAGRRVLLLLSTVGMVVATSLLTVALKTAGHGFTTPLSVLSVVLFVSSFGIGLGPVGWLLPAEIMPGETRALASSVAASVNWLANFIASQAFLVIANALGGYAFVPFGLCLVSGLVFIMCFVPETKGKSLEQIQSELAHGSASYRS